MCGHCSFFTRTQEPYNLLLERREWGAKRMRILTRDQYTCCKCGRKEGEGITLHVHHKHYIYGLDPWEYKDSELQTLCEDCHSYLHSHCKVPVYRLDGMNLVEVNLTPCSRCGGAGWFPEYKHVQNGICFRCHGAKYEEIIDVVEEYSKEHNIDIASLDDGFRPFGPEIEGVGTIIEAHVCSRSNHKGVYAQLLMSNGIYYPCCLDYSVDAEPGQMLDPNQLRYKTAIMKNGEKYIIIKGHRIATSLVPVWK